MWFESLTGFREESPEQVREHIHVEGEAMTSRVNGRVMVCGRLETPSLAELRAQVAECGVTAKGKLQFTEVVADVQRLHQNPNHANALFQVASQFNLLEMTGPGVTPEAGVDRYENDFTQGPACAIAAGAGTIYRNYFAPIAGQIGQSSENQLDCLSDLGTALGNIDGRLWSMRNGYALASEEGLARISAVLSSLRESERDRLRGLLRVGLQLGTEVTLGDSRHLVNQLFGSALPVSYCPHPPEAWAEFAQLVLEASYEAVLSAAIVHQARTGNRQVFLTQIGGGAFGNRKEWIHAAMHRALRLFESHDLAVAVVSRSRPDPSLAPLLESWR